MISWNLTATKDTGGKVIGIQGVGQDITERKRAEEALRESKEELRSIFDSSPDAITVTDLNGVIKDCNQTTLDLHGYSSKNVDIS